MNSYDNNGQINNYNNSYMNEPEQRKIPYVTAVLVAINVVVFLVMEFFGSTESGEYMYYMWHSRRHNLIRNRNDNRRVLHKCRSFRSNFWHLRCPTGNDIQKQKPTGTGSCTTTNLVIYTNGLRQHAGRRRLDGTSGRSSYRSCYCISNI